MTGTLTCPIIFLDVDGVLNSHQWFESQEKSGVQDRIDRHIDPQAVLRLEPMIGEIQYVSVDDRDTMRPLEDVGREGCTVSLAVKCGNVRLIDNFVFDTFVK